MPPIYLDNAASTRVADEVIALMTEVMRTAWGNPSAAHPQGAAARAYIEEARTRMLAALGDKGTGDIIWTSGCTEADALAVFGAARVRDGSIVLSSIEHPAVSAAAMKLEGSRPVVKIPVGKDAQIDPDAAAEAAKGAAVVAIVMVQNELGVVQPVAAIAQAIRRVNASCHIHVDAAQAFGKIPIDVSTLGADSLAIAGHKLHAPKGTGALWLRSGVALEPLWVGGGQQRGLRGGTQDAPGTAGLGLAAERAIAALPTARTRWLELAAIVTAKLDAAKLPYVGAANTGAANTGAVGAANTGAAGAANTGAANVGAANTGNPVSYRQLVPDHRRAPHILAIGLRGVPASALRTVMSSRGVYISTGSACAERDEKPSAVLAAIDLPADVGMCRLSFGLETTAAEVEQAATILCEVATSLAKR